MQDKDYMENLLNACKGVADLYMHGTIESAASPNVHRVFHQALCEILSMQNELYKKMEQKGWYNTTQVEQNKIMQLKQQYSSQTQQN